VAGGRLNFVEAGKPLRQQGIDRLMGAYVTDDTHLTNRDARRLARAMRIIGKRPSYREVSHYIGAHWNRWPDVAALMRDGWRSVSRAQTAFGRESHWYGTPLQLADVLIEKHEPQLRTEARLAAVAHDALDALIEAAEQPDTATYLNRKRQLADALRAVQHLRYLRQGAGALGFQTLDPGAAPRPRW